MQGEATGRMLARARRLYLDGNPAEAQGLCDTILSGEPDHIEALHLKAAIALSAGEAREGAMLLRQALALESAPARSCGPCSGGTPMPDEPDTVVATFRRGLMLRPDDAGLHVKLAAALCDRDRFEEAEAASRRAIALDPSLPAAHFHLAIALTAQARLVEAAAAYRSAIALDPDSVEAILNLGNVLIAQDGLDGAIAAYRRAVALKPDLAAGHLNLAVALHRRRDDAAALAAALKAAMLEPARVETHRALGVILRDLGRLDAAAAAFRHALTLRPADAALHCELGATLGRQGRRDDALAACREAIALDPANGEARRLMALLLHDLGRINEAIGAYQRALALNPRDAVAASNLGAALCARGRFDEAIEACRRAIAHAPAHAPAHTNLGVIFEAQGRLEEAVAAHRAAIAADPAYAKAYRNLAIPLRDLGLIDEAAAAARRAVELAPDDPLARFNHALFLLMNGDYAAGFQEYEARRRCAALEADEQTFAQPEWEGEPLDGRTLLLHAERGFGDSLQFMRFIPLAAARGGAIVLQVQPALTRLARSMPGIRVVGRGEPLPEFDLHLPLMSLPRVLGITLDAIPTAIPYLHPEPAKLHSWRQRFDADPGLHVGVVWAGNPGHKGDRRRSLPAAAVLPRLIMPGVRLYSLQKDIRPADRAAIAALGDAVTKLGTALHDFSDTAAAVAALDLVIAVDTSVAHLAGALGRPVWVMLPFALDWRWLRVREDTPWYPTLRLFRQPRPNDWDDVLTRLTAALARAACAAQALGPECRRPARAGSLASAAINRCEK